MASDDVFVTLRYPAVTLPLDEEGYTLSFRATQVEAYTKFFKQYGLLIIDDVLDKEDIDATIDEVWREIENFDWTPYDPSVAGNKVNRNDTRTWEDTHFPTSKEGFLGLVITEGKQAFKNRQNETMYSIFKELMGQEELWVSLDRYGIMRPTKDVPEGPLQPVVHRGLAEDNTGTLEKKDHPSWKTKKSWLHWDLNPWIWTSSNDGNDYEWNDNFIQENNGSRNYGRPKLQGFLNLVDNKIGDGGFACVPGFPSILKDYCEKSCETPYAKSLKIHKEFEFVEVREDDPMQEQVDLVSLRAGSLLIWTSELPHCNYPNDSSKFRITQYVKMFEAQDNNAGLRSRQQTVRAILAKNGVKVTSELGEKLLGLKKWHH